MTARTPEQIALEVSEALADAVAQFAVQTNPYGLSISIDKAHEFAEYLMLHFIVTRAARDAQAEPDFQPDAMDQGVHILLNKTSDDSWFCSCGGVGDNSDPNSFIDHTIESETAE